jgi:hypothetical protein
MADGRYSTWTNNYRLLHALSMYRRSLTPPSQGNDLLPSLDELGVDAPRNTGYAWSRWWRRSQATAPNSAPSAPPLPPAPSLPEPAPPNSRYAKTLRLSSDQLVSTYGDLALTRRNNWISRRGQILFNSQLPRPTRASRSALPEFFFGRKQIK